jgi:hypothetical protein
MPYTIIRTLKNWIRFEVVPHPHYSLDLATPDIWLFVALKKCVQDIPNVMKKFKLLWGKWL